MREQPTQLKSFLMFVADNEQELKKALSRAFTIRKDDLDELFQEAIIKACSAIIRGTKIANYKSYFFIVCRSVYMTRERTEKRRRERGERLWLDSHDVEQETDLSSWQRELRDEALRDVITLITARYGQEITALFVLNKIYPRRWTSKAIGEGAEMKPRNVSAILKSVSRFLQSDRRAKRIMRRLQDAIYDND